MALYSLFLNAGVRVSTNISVKCQRLEFLHRQNQIVVFDSITHRIRLDCLEILFIHVDYHLA